MPAPQAPQPPSLRLRCSDHDVRVPALDRHGDLLHELLLPLSRRRQTGGDTGEPVENDEHDATSAVSAEQTSSPEQAQTPSAAQTSSATQSSPAAQAQTSPAPEIASVTFYTTSKIPRTHQQNKSTEVRVRTADIALDVVRKQFPITAELKTEEDYKKWIHSEGRKMGSKRETGVIATLRNWYRYPDPDDDANNVETSMQMISKNPTIVRKSIIVYCAWRDYCVVDLNGAAPRRQMSLSYFDDVDIAVIQSPHRLRLLFKAFLDASDDEVKEYAGTRLKMKALAETVLFANPYIGSVLTPLDHGGKLVLQVALLDSPRR